MDDSLVRLFVLRPVSHAHALSLRPLANASFSLAHDSVRDMQLLCSWAVHDPGVWMGRTNSNMKNREPLSAFPAYFSYCSDILFFLLPCPLHPDFPFGLGQSLISHGPGVLSGGACAQCPSAPKRRDTPFLVMVLFLPCELDEQCAWLGGPHSACDIAGGRSVACHLFSFAHALLFIIVAGQCAVSVVESAALRPHTTLQQAQDRREVLPLFVCHAGVRYCSRFRTNMLAPAQSLWLGNRRILGFSRPLCRVLAS